MSFRIENEWPKGIQRPCLGSLIVDVKGRIWTCTAVGWEWAIYENRRQPVWCITITEQEGGQEKDLSFAECYTFFTSKLMAVFGQKKESENNE